MQHTPLLKKKLCQHCPLLWILVYLLLLPECHTESVPKNGIQKDFSGVLLDPYVIPAMPDDWTCLEKHMKAMLEVISSRFSHVANQWYILDTGHVDCSDLIPSVSANLNRAKNTTILDVLLYVGPPANQTEIAFKNAISNIEYAWSRAVSANKVYPKTVYSIVLEVTDSILENDTLLYPATQMIEHARNLSQNAHSVSFGISLLFEDCTSHMDSIPDNLHYALNTVDVIIFRHKPTSSQQSLGPLKASQQITEQFSKCKRKIEGSLSNNKTVTVMFSPQWPNEADSSNLTLFNKVTYWQLVSDWAAEEQTRVYFVNAFDSPYQADPEVRQVGWWKIKRKDRDAGKITKSSFVEKILDPRSSEEEQRTTEYLKDDDAIESIQLLSPGSLAMITITVALIVVTCGGLVVALLCRKKRLRLSKGDVEEFMEGYGVSVMSGKIGLEVGIMGLPYDQTYELAKHSFSIDYSKFLGSGHFGLVFQGSIRGIRDSVAFKVSTESSSKTMLKSLLSEIKVMSFVGSHDFIVNFVGAYTAEMQNGVVYVATELCEVGSLNKYLRRQTRHGGIEYSVPNQKTIIGHSDMLRWSFQIASGMEYIASKKVVHADLATRNVLLTSSLTAKISDFGLSRRLYNYTSYYIKKQQEPLPWRWMSIEALKFLRFTEKSDVWAFGCTMWEIYSGGTVPYPGFSFGTQFMDELERGYRLPCPAEATQGIYDIMSLCWISNISQRASFTQLRAALMRLMSENDGYLKL